MSFIKADYKREGPALRLENVEDKSPFGEIGNSVTFSD